MCGSEGVFDIVTVEHFIKWARGLQKKWLNMLLFLLMSMYFRNSILFKKQQFTIKILSQIIWFFYSLRIDATYCI